MTTYWKEHGYSAEEAEHMERIYNGIRSGLREQYGYSRHEMPKRHELFCDLVKERQAEKAEDVVRLVDS